MARRIRSSLGLPKRLAVAACLAPLSLTASASPAPASVTIGQIPAAPPSASCIVGGDADWLQPTVTSGNTYVVPTAGTITSWTHFAALGDGQNLVMKVFRKVADPALYMAVGHDGPHALIPAILNSFSASIAVKPGDLLGLETLIGPTTGCRFSAPGDSYVFRNGSLDDGQAGAFLPGEPDTRLNITATLAPTNSFSFGKPGLNKKNGTATLTVSVPNSGELTGSGKGVTAASARAMTSKSVAAGPAQLLIKAKGKKKKTLNETGKVKLNVAITYTPTGGDPNTQSVKVKLKKKL